MKMLWLYDSYYKPDYNHWYRIDFVKYLKQNFNLDILVYGWNSDKNYPELSLIKFNLKKTLKDIKKEFNFDIVIIDGHNRNGIKRRLSIWKNIKDYPTIYMEGDFHGIVYSSVYPNWLKNINPKIILHRHKSNIIRGVKKFPEFKHKWFPCSVDTKVFKPNPNIERKQKIVFIGSNWASRRSYLTALEKSNLGDIFDIQYHNKNVYPNKFKLFTGHFYIKILRSYISAFNHSGTIYQNIDNAKMFEIMACKTVLLTNECNNGIKDLFPEGSYIVYKNEKNMIEKAKWIIEHSRERKIITDKALKCIKTKHTHEVRAKELIDIIKQEFKI